MLFVAVSRYLTTPETRNDHIAEHRDWEVRHYEGGRLLATGPQSPPVGGVLIFRAETHEDAVAFVASDPFSLHNVAEYSIYGFEPTERPWRSAAIEAFLNVTDSEGL